MISYIEIHNPENIPQLRHAWKAAIDSEPIFRTSFDLRDGRGSLIENHSADFCWREVNVHHEEAYAAEISSEQARTTGPTMSFKIVTSSRLKNTGKSAVI